MTTIPTNQVKWKEIGELELLSTKTTEEVPIFQDTKGRYFILCDCELDESGEIFYTPVKIASH
jgi:hypothetical protein